MRIAKTKVSCRKLRFRNRCRFEKIGRLTSQALLNPPVHRSGIDSARFGRCIIPVFALVLDVVKMDAIFGHFQPYASLPVREPVLAQTRKFFTVNPLTIGCNHTQICRMTAVMTSRADTTESPTEFAYRILPTTVNYRRMIRSVNIMNRLLNVVSQFIGYWQIASRGIGIIVR